LERNECLKEFIRAAGDARCGEYGRARSLVERIRKEDGDTEANAMRAEIWRFANLDETDWQKSVAEISIDI
jgi:hypothetical protein